MRDDQEHPRDVDASFDDDELELYDDEGEAEECDWMVTVAPHPLEYLDECR